MKVQEHSAYKKAREVANLIWRITRTWDKENLKLFGYQLIRSADSISANLSEGWLRYSKKDKINFYIIARGSVGETIDWIEKATTRNLINSKDYSHFKDVLDELPKDINGLIKGTQNNLKK